MNPEFSLFDYIEMIVRRKFLVLFMTLLGIGLASGYLYYAKPTFKTIVRLAPLKDSTFEILKAHKIEEHNNIENLLTTLTSSFYWGQFTKNNIDYDFRLVDLKIIFPKKGQNDYRVELFGSDKAKLPVVLDKFLEFSEQLRKKEIEEGYKISKENFVNEKRESLKKALEIAKKVNLKKPMISSAENIEAVEYLKGVDVIELELKQLEDVKTSIDLSQVTIFNVGPATIPLQQISPNKKLVLLTTTILFFLWGLALAVTLEVFNIKKKALS